MPVVFPEGSKERIQAMLTVLRGETVTFERDGVKHTLTPDAGKERAMSKQGDDGVEFANGFLFGLVVGGVFAGIGAAFFAATTYTEHWQHEAVKHNAARYNPETAAFEWSQPSEARDD